MVTFEQYIFFIATAFYTISNAEIIYSSGFEQQDWTEDVGSFDPSVHTFTPIEWYNYDGDYPNCPRYNVGDFSSGAGSCVRTLMDATISRVISTVGYHSIHLQIDVNPRGLESDDVCILQYRTATTGWVNTNIVSGVDDISMLDVSITTPDTNTYNNQESFEIKVGIAGHQGGDSCLYDNLKVFGTPYSTKDPSSNPSQMPITYPTKRPTINPTKNPSMNPSMNPTKGPTVRPTTSPTDVHFESTASVVSKDKITSNDNGLKGWLTAILVVSGITCCLCIAFFVMIGWHQRTRSGAAEFDHEVQNKGSAYVIESRPASGNVQAVQAHITDVACIVAMESGDTVPSKVPVRFPPLPPVPGKEGPDCQTQALTVHQYSSGERNGEDTDALHVTDEGNFN